MNLPTETVTSPADRWRLVLGRASDPDRCHNFEDSSLAGMDEALSALYDLDRSGGLSGSSPKINRWLGDIRRYFPESAVRTLQHDALERLGLRQMLTEPELLNSLQPDIHLAATLLGLGKSLPEETKSTAREVVRRVTEDIERRLRAPLLEAIRGSLNRAVRNPRPKANEVDWQRTIRHNLKHYRPELGTVIPERVFGYGRKGHSLKHVVLLLDQSGSMASSIVYGAVAASVLAGIRSLKTHLIAFDTAVVDLTEEVTDPVDLLFGIQLGGGTDIHRALEYGETLIVRPIDTILILISDLYEGGNRSGMLATAQRLVSAGVSVICLLALSDEGRPSFDAANARALLGLGIPAFACTPDRFPELMAAAIEKKDISRFGSSP